LEEKKKKLIEYNRIKTINLANSENLLQKALNKDNENLVQYWLTYWIGFATFCVLDGFAYNILCWIPAYWLLRSAVLLWLYLPATKGVKVLQRYLIVSKPQPIDATLKAAGNES